MTSVQRKDCLAQKGQASKTPTGLSSHRSDNEDYKDPLKSNNPRLPKAFTGSSQAPPPEVEMNIA